MPRGPQLRILCQHGWADLLHAREREMFFDAFCHSPGDGMAARAFREARWDGMHVPRGSGGT